LSLFALALRVSSAVRSERLTGVTIDQWLPTGQRWNLHQPQPNRLQGRSRNPDRREQMAFPAPNHHIATHPIPA
jgi:hypothetical protein